MGNAEKLSSSEKRVLVSTCYGHFVSHFNMLIFPAILLPLVERLHSDVATVLGLSFWMYVFFGVTALPWGMAADRWGAKPFLTLFFIGAGASSLLAATRIDSPMVFSLSLALIGLFSGIYHPIGLGMISKEINRVSVAMAYNGMFGNLGLAMAPIIAGGINWFWGPAAVYVVAGCLNLSGVLLMVMLPAGHDKKVIDIPLGEKPRILLPMAFFLLLIAMMLGGISYRGATVSIPAYFEMSNQAVYDLIKHLLTWAPSKNVVATAITSMIYVIGVLGQFYGGHAAERYVPAYVYLIFHTITVPLAFAMALTHDFGLIAVTTAYFFFLLGMQPAENTLVAGLTPKSFHHSAFGLKFVLTFGVGALSVKMVGAIEKYYNMASVFYALSLISLILVGFVVLLIIHLKKNPIQDSGV